MISVFEPMPIEFPCLLKKWRIEIPEDFGFVESTFTHRPRVGKRLLVTLIPYEFNSLSQSAEFTDTRGQTLTIKPTVDLVLTFLIVAAYHSRVLFDDARKARSV